MDEKIKYLYTVLLDKKILKSVIKMREDYMGIVYKDNSIRVVHHPLTIKIRSMTKWIQG